MEGDKPVVNTTLIDPAIRNKTAMKIRSKNENILMNDDILKHNSDDSKNTSKSNDSKNNSSNNDLKNTSKTNDLKNNSKTNLLSKKQNEVSPILLESPSSSNHRVTFDFSPRIKEIPSNSSQSKRKEDILVEDRRIIIKKSLLNIVKSKAKKYTTLIPSSNKIILKYKTEEDLESDLRNIASNESKYKNNGKDRDTSSKSKNVNSNEKNVDNKKSVDSKKNLVSKDNKNVNSKKSFDNKKSFVRDEKIKNVTDVENKIIVYNLSYKETEESVSKFFQSFGTVLKTVLEKNSKGFCTGKAVVTFMNPFKDDSVLRLNGRLLRIEKMKKQKINKTRLFISHMKKNMKIAELRQILKTKGFVPKSIKIDLNEGRNRGYGFIEFNSAEEAERLIKEYKKIQEEIGEKSEVEYSKEKY